ncbi:MAG: hypothetical protein F6J92_22530 [Symploca sp. SIO1A3]|nr:hypothetical protein [Symploca sp. SIO2C1]NER49419.1 hypothetical protein [Symploca sp. SIO1A3]
MSYCHDTLGVLSSHLNLDWLVLAQTIEDPDLLGQIQDTWNNFVKSGQIWALLIGIVIGYFFRNFTSFG